MRIPDYFFYLEPLDSHTNQVFASILADDLRLSKRVVNDEKGKHLAETLWLCTLKQLKYFNASISDQCLKFLTYGAKTPTGSIQRFRLLEKGFRKKSRTATVRNRLEIVRRQQSLKAS